MFMFLLGAFSSASMLPAAVVLPSDVVVSGRYLFDTDGSEATGNVIQVGDIFSTVGGVTRATNTRYDGVNVTGNNPILANFTHHGGGSVGGGDGFGGSASVDAASGMFVEVFRADTDLDNSNVRSSPLLITNQSTTESYEIAMSLTFDHFVDADGFDAAVRSDIDLELNGVNEFRSEIVSDTVFGDFTHNGELLSAGDFLEDSGIFQFSRLLRPGESLSVGLDYTLEGGTADGFTMATSSYFLSLDNVTAVPEPVHTSQAIVALVGFYRLFRRRKPRINDR